MTKAQIIELLAVQLRTQDMLRVCREYSADTWRELPEEDRESYRKKARAALKETDR